MSGFYQEERKVFYIAPTDVIWQSKGVKNAARLFDVAGENATIWRKPGLHMPPGGRVVLEYDTELPLQGIRISRGLDNVEPRPVQVRVRFGESVSEVVGEPNNDHSMHDQVLSLAAMGVSRIGNSGFRFLCLDNLDSEVVLNLRECSAEAWVHPAKSTGYFECSDELLNKIYHACTATLNKCISPLLLDGAKRDRLVWMGDMYNEIRACGVLFQKHTAIPESLDFVAEEALANGCFNGIPAYTAYWFLAQREYYHSYADGKYLRRQHDNFKIFGDLLLKGFEKDPDGIMATSIVDWGHPDRTPENTYGPLYMSAVQACRDIAILLGEEKLSERCDAVEKGIKMRFKLAGLPKSAAAWAALSGLASYKKVYNEVLSVNPTDGLSTFHFDNFLRVYRAAGETQKALDLLRKYYGGMLKVGSRTIWEQFELSWLKNASPIDKMPKAGKVDIHSECGRGCFRGVRNSLCHGWGASPIAWMMETLAGISPVGDGFSRGVKVVPNLCDLDYVSAICPTPFGDLTVMARRGEKLIVDAPKGLKVIRR